jgi:hypothetical protein
MEEDRKENRRNNYKSKKNKASYDYSLERKDKQKIQKAFKHRKKQLEEEESWELWEDEIY